VLCQSGRYRYVFQTKKPDDWPVRKILILKFGALGDVVMATPLVAAICAKHDDAHCSLLTTPAFAPLFSGWKDLHVVAIDRHGLRNLWHMLRFIRAGEFERIYDLQGNDRSGLLLALAGRSEKVGIHPRFPYTHHPDEKWDGQSHIFSRMRAVLESAGVGDVSDRPVLLVDDAMVTRVAQWLEKNALARGRFALLHAGASPTRPGKRWPYFDALAQRLLAAGIEVVWLGGESDRDLNRRLARNGGIDAAGAFTIVELAELGRSARFAVTNDSGPMHVLSAAGIPVFGLFGPSDWRRNHALGQANRVITPDNTGSASVASTGGDIANIPVDEVWQRLLDERLLDDPTVPGDLSR
jgi:ADP-heptose:LPS heptosyltransferase